MTDVDRIQVIQIGLSIFALWVVYAQLYKRTRVDRFREDLFTIRDDMFTFVAQHGRAFDLPAYVLFRQSLNGMIRTAGAVTVFQLWFFGWALRRAGHQMPNISSAIREIDDREIQDYLAAAYKKVSWRVHKFLLFEGLQVIPFGTAILMIMLISGASDKFRVAKERWRNKVTDRTTDEFAVLNSPEFCLPGIRSFHKKLVA